MTRISDQKPHSSYWLLPTLVVGLLSGCGYQVAITYLKPRQPTDSQASIANVYMVVHCPDVSATTISSKQGFFREADLPIELDIDRFASKVAIFLRDRGGRLAAYRVQRSGEDSFAESLHPTSLLQVDLQSPVVEETEQKETVSEKEGDRTVEKERSYWQAKAHLRVSARLVRLPENNPLGSAERNLEMSQRFETQGGDALRSRFADQTTKLLDQSADWLIKTVIPVDIVTRHRKLYTVDSDAESVAAAKAGERQHWSEATPIWQNRLAKNPASWRDAWNLGVGSERERHFDAARDYYLKAQTLSAGDKDAPKAEEWAILLQDLEQPLDMTDAAPNSADPWFQQRIAVLPFSDVSTSVDGPVNVRHLTHAVLSRNGYAVLPLADVDRILQENGFTQGGQLTATTPAQLSQWLKADLLVYGHLEKFDEFTLGIFGWKRINGTYKVWSAAKKDFLWVSEKSVSRLATANVKSGQDVGWAFLQQLLGSWADKASHKPMSEESSYYVNEQLLEIPRRPH